MTAIQQFSNQYSVSARRYMATQNLLTTLRPSQKKAFDMSDNAPEEKVARLGIRLSIDRQIKLKKYCAVNRTNITKVLGDFIDTLPDQ
jgi:hypothetical protein